MSKRTWKSVREDIIDENRELGADFAKNGARYAFISAVIAARNARGWSQRDLAEAIGVSQPVIARLERGERDPRLSTMVALCEALNLPLVVGKPQQRLAG